jgi:hypothetical protein
VTVGARIVETLWRARRDSRRYGRTEQGSCSGPFGIKTSDAGFALLDVVVAITVLIVVLLPVAYLLSTTSKIQGTNQNRLTAQGLAASWLEQERTVAQQSTLSAPASISPPFGSAAAPTWPPVSGVVPVGTINYDIYIAGGYCAYSGSGTAWTNGGVTTTTNGVAAPLTYFIAVKVAWGPDAGNANPTSLGQNDGTFVEYSSVQSGPLWTVSVSGGAPVSVLTLTTTTGINGLCPLGLTGQD